MTKKWEQFKAKLPRLRAEPEWQQKVDEVKASFADADPRALVRRLRMAKSEKEELDARVKAINVVEEALKQLLLAYLESHGLQRATYGDGTIFISDEPYARIADRARLIAYLKANGHEEILSVHWQTLNALVKERLTAGEDAPPGCEVYMKTSVSLRKES